MPTAGRKWTPAQRSAFKRTLREKKRARLAAANSQPTPSNDPLIPQAALDFAHGHVRGWLDAFAARINVPVSDLTERVGALLSSREGGKKSRA